MSDSTTTPQVFDPSDVKFVKEIYATRRILMNGAEVEYTFLYKFEDGTIETLIMTHHPSVVKLRDLILGAGYIETNESVGPVDAVVFRRKVQS